MKRYGWGMVCVGALLIWVVVLAGSCLSGCTVRPSGPIRIFSTANLLANPSFEEPYIEQGAPELKVAEGWIAWWDPRDTRPEYKPATPENSANGPPRIREGERAQQFFNNWGKHTAGVYQTVSGLTPGAELRFSAWVQAFSSNENDFWHSAGKYRMRIGLDPYGGQDPESPDVVWSNGGHAVEPYDEYEYLEVDTVAKSDRATVFVWGQAEWRLHHNNAYVDDARLVQAVGLATPTPGPGPTPGGVDYDEIERRMRDVFREMWPEVE